MIIEYPKIDAIFCRNLETKKIEEGNYRDKAFEYLKNIDWEFITKTDIGIEDFGIEIEVYYMSTRNPSKIYIKKIENILKNTKNNKKLGEYLTNVKFLKVEEIQ